MSDEFYLDLLEEVTETVQEFGTTYKVVGVSQYDETTMTTLPATERTVVGLVADQQLANQLMSDQGASWIAVKSLLLTADANPQPGERVEVDGVLYPLDKLMEIKPANITLLYMLDVTR